MRKNLVIIIIGASMMLLESCSLFKKSVELDMQPFADNTNILFQEAAKVDRPFQFKSLATYKNIKKYRQLELKAKPIIYGLKGISYYSNQLVAISNSSMSEKGKNEQLAFYMEEALERIEHKERMDSLGLTHSQVDSTIRQIRRAESFRNGIEAADPIVKSIVISMFDRLDELESLIKEVVISFEDQIYEDHELAIANYLTLKNLQNITHYKLTQLYYAQVGHTSSIDSLIVSDESLAKFFYNENPNDQINFDNAEGFLLKRLENIDAIIRQLDDDKQDFRDMKSEISEWQLQADEKIKIARNSLIIWSQSHKNLGRGIVTPPLVGIESLTKIVIPALEKAL